MAAPEATVARPAPVAQPRPAAAEARSAVWLGRALRLGVLAAAGFVLAGLGLCFAGGHGGPASLDEALGRDVAVAAVRPATIARGLAHGAATAYVEAGILLLILTPTVRVAMTLGFFVHRRDWLFAALAGFVLAILLLGLVGIGA